MFRSSIGTEKRHGVGEIDGLDATELELERSSASVTHLRCEYFFTNLLMDADSIRDGVLATAFDNTRAMPWDAPGDIAAVATTRLLSQRWKGRHVQAVHGPEDLSFMQVAHILAVTLGHPINAHQINDDAHHAEELGGRTPRLTPVQEVNGATSFVASVLAGHS